MKTSTKVGTTGAAALVALYAALGIMTKPTHYAIVEYTDGAGTDGQRDTVGTDSYEDCIVMIDTLTANIRLDNGTIDAVECVEAEDL